MVRIELAQGGLNPTSWRDNDRELIDVTTRYDRTRRQVLRRSLAAVGGGLAALGAGAARAQEKLDPKLVQYQTTPKDGNKCSACVNWVDPASCKIVSGKIAPDGWCVAFAPKNA
jgi:hypothetical protein